jgi:hypothetical protein
MKCFLVFFLMLNFLTLQPAYAHEKENEVLAQIHAYCQYIYEKNTAKGILLLTPDAIVRLDNGNVYNKLQTVIIAGLSKDLSDFKKAKLTKQLIHDECTYYRLKQEAKLQIAFALPKIKKESLELKLQQIDYAKEQLTRLLGRIKQRIKTHNDTLRSYYQVDLSLKRVEDMAREIHVELATEDVPAIPHAQLSHLLKELWIISKQRQQTLNQLRKQNDWSVQLQAGAQQNLSYPQNQTIQPYFSFLFRYNLGAVPSAKALDHSVDSYMRWQKNQVFGTQRQLSHLISALKAMKLAEEERLAYLNHSYQKYDGLLKNMQDIQAIEVIRFKQEMEVDKILMNIDVKFVQAKIRLLEKSL